MDTRCPFPVTEEHFSVCWEFVDKKFRTARIRSVIARSGGFLVHFFFLCCLIFCANGLIFLHAQGSYCRFLRELPFFLPLWQRISQTLLTPGAALVENALKLYLASCLVSALVFALWTCLIRLFYHPKKTPQPTLSYRENAALLSDLAQKARSCARRTEISASIVGTVLAVFLSFGLFFAYAFYLQDAETITRVLSLFPTSDAATNALIYVLLLYVLSDILSKPFLLISRPLYYCVFPYDLVVQAQRAALLARQEDTPAAPEALREQAVELEKISAYGKARELFLEAALLGDTLSMEHYARHCIIGRIYQPAMYWLKACAPDSGVCPTARRQYIQLKLGTRPDVHYLNFEKPKKNPFLLVLTVLWRLFWIAALLACCWVVFAYFDSLKNPGKYAELSAAVAQWLAAARNSLSK